MELSEKFRGKDDLELKIKDLKDKLELTKKQNFQTVQGYKNIIDQKELEIQEYKKQIKKLQEDLKKEKEYSKMLYESP